METRAHSQMLFPMRACATGLAVDLPLPGSIYFLSELPAPADVPLELAAAPFATVFLDALGQRLVAPPHALARPDTGRVGGNEVRGLFVHPPDEGTTVAVYSAVLPPSASAFEASVGLRDGADESTGADCVVEINGQEVARARVLPGEGLVSLRADIRRWAGRPAVLALTTGSAGSCVCDWVMWGAPAIREAP